MDDGDGNDDDDEGFCDSQRQHARQALWTRDELGLDSTGSWQWGSDAAGSDINKL